MIAPRTALRGADLARWFALRSDRSFRAVTGSGSSLAERLSAPAAARAAEHAIERVPAYRAFVGPAPYKWQGDAACFVERLPITDKQSYIDRYPMAERCVDGYIPAIGTQLDESSGSSGVPYTWVRSAAELHELHLSLSRLAEMLFGEHLVTLNGFSMGAWATGANTTAALLRNGIVKSIGPDVGKILSALELLGPQRTYVITGYPPFLRELLDAGDAAGFDWQPYHLFGVVGGEGMSEMLRARLERRFVAVYSAYGASDLDIGVASELPLSVWMRQRAAERPELARALFGDDRRLPMLFHYNPLDYYVETNDADELIITVNRLSMLSPRIRYNIHDAGGTLSFDRALEICRDFGLDPLGECASAAASLRLPFLFVSGRSDSTLSYMGCNIYPDDVEQALYRDAQPKDRDRIAGFCLELVEQADARVRPCVHVEVTGAAGPDLSARLAVLVRERLLTNSADFRTAVSEDPAAGSIAVQLHRPGVGPFADNAHRIKRKYVITTATRHTEDKAS